MRVTGQASLQTAVQGFRLDDPCPDVTDPIPDALPVPKCTPAWTTPVDGDASTAAVGAGQATLYVGTTAGTVYALDADTGAIRWSTPLGGGALPAPAFDGRQVYVTTSDGSVVALDAGDGSVRWRSAPGSGSTRPVVAGGVVYTGAADGTIRAFDTEGCGRRDVRLGLVDRQRHQRTAARRGDGSPVQLIDSSGLTAYAPVD